MKKPHYWQESIDYLCQQDEKLATIIENHNNHAFDDDKSALESLLHSIVSQQISVKAAASIWQRIIDVVGEITTVNVLAAGFDKLRACGLSNQKTQYCINIAEHFRANKINDAAHWQNRDYPEIVEELTGIKGVGPWTAQMFGMFYLLEPDIFPLKDIGIIRAINQLYSSGDKELEMSEIIEISNQWQPYRTVAALFLWRFIDAE
ncbi:MAG TPA: DNA-3-methyladenine glycosylase 2 family protein [Candidatus Thioglobus sp.]|nr:DNA-3-methyladenine glycosylase 2 family protein [Candidatus Thioglobus sp.]